MRIVRWLAVIALALPAAAWADDHRADMNGGISGGKASKLFGIHVTFAMPIPDQEKWSLLADISHHWDLNDETRAWFKRFLEKNNGRPQSMIHAGTYGAVLHYLRDWVPTLREPRSEIDTQVSEQLIGLHFSR